jgi:hypothetical protein
MIRHFTDYRAYQAALKRLTHDGFPKAMAATINATAKATHNRSLRNVRERFTLRNTYTERSIRFSEARVKSRGHVGYAVTGSKSPYLPTQETGATIRASRRKIAIPTRAARTGGLKVKPVARRYRMNQIGRVGRGSKFFFIPLRKPGLFTRRDKKLVMIRDISVRSYRLRPTRWHGDAVRQFAKRSLIERVYIREAQKQLGMIR